MGQGVVYVTIQEGPFVTHDIQVCVDTKGTQMNVVVMWNFCEGNGFSKFQRHLQHHESKTVEVWGVDGARVRLEGIRLTELPENEW